MPNSIDTKTPLSTQSPRIDESSYLQNISDATWIPALVRHLALCISVTRVQDSTSTLFVLYIVNIMRVGLYPTDGKRMKNINGMDL
jgi:hypothetical protein